MGRCNTKWSTCEHNNLGYCKKFKKWKRTEKPGEDRVYVRLIECLKEEYESNKREPSPEVPNDEIPF